jgi:hypothetical protein
MACGRGPGAGRDSGRAAGPAAPGANLGGRPGPPAGPTPRRRHPGHPWACPAGTVLPAPAGGGSPRGPASRGPPLPDGPGAARHRAAGGMSGAPPPAGIPGQAAPREVGSCPIAVPHASVALLGEAGEERSPCAHAHRGRGVGSEKACTGQGQLVEKRRMHHRVAVDAQAIPPPLIDADQHHVGTLLVHHRDPLPPAANRRSQRDPR